jgi:hypothetical protein
LDLGLRVFTFRLFDFPPGGICVAGYAVVAGLDGVGRVSGFGVAFTVVINIFIKYIIVIIC